MASTDPEEPDHPIWDLIPLTGYELPSAPTVSNARRGLLSLTRRFRRRQQEREGPVRSEDQLHALAPDRLDAVAGAIDWRGAAEVLQAALAERSAADRAWFIIGSPGGGYGELLETWATAQGAACVPAPAYEVVAGEHTAWLEDLPDGADPWALPRLERCWLRHPAGLDLVRRLFERLCSGKLGFGVIGCDSWAWAYLRFVVPTQVARALTFQAFDGARLALWLSTLAAAGDARPRRFLHAQSGNLVLAVNDDDASTVSTELRYLAAQARGNPSTALRRWRSRLRSEPEEPEAADDESNNKPEVETIWVSPAADAELPSGLGEPEALILHALLLHDGLPNDILEGLLPNTRSQTRGALLQLAAADVVQADPDGAWRVTASAYPAVRSFLSSRSFLIGDL